MKTFKKWALIILSAVVVIVIVVLSYVTLALPDVGKPENIKITYTPQRIEHGKYLANHVVNCMDCHSDHDTTSFNLPIDTDKLGIGGMKFDASVGFPGLVTVPNITPAKLKDWTDGEIFRAITTGVRKDGSTIFPIMPWMYYSKMDREDIYDIIAYVRTLKEQETDYPARKLDFPLNIIVHLMPKKASLGKRPDEKDTVKYGEYLVQIAACKDCHSQDNQGNILPGMEFAGGKAFRLNGGTIKSANITQDKETGIGSWTKEQFMTRFLTYGDPKYVPNHVAPGQFQTIMPWTMLGSMKRSDLDAIYAYIKTIKPVKNQVVKFEPDKRTGASE